MHLVKVVDAILNTWKEEEEEEQEEQKQEQEQGK